jgi:GT2 family glycosyltransferase
MVDVSIIIVSWNAKKYLLDCLNSLIQRQKEYSQELIVVDNASSDGSAELVEKDFPQVKLIRNEENLGFAKANNIGIRASNARYVCLINSDVILLDHCIEKLIDFMDSHPSTGMIGPKILNPDRSLQPQCQHFPTIWNHLCQTFGFNKLFPNSALFSEPFMRYWAYNETKKVEVINGCFWIIRREALDKVGLLDEDFFFYGEDIDWCKRFQNAGWEVMFNPNAAAIHFGGASSANAPIRFYIELQKADLRYWRKHHGRLGYWAYWMIILLRQLVRLPVYVLICIFQPVARSKAIFKLKRAFTCIRWLFGLCKI